MNFCNEIQSQVPVIFKVTITALLWAKVCRNFLLLSRNFLQDQERSRDFQKRKIIFWLGRFWRKFHDRIFPCAKCFWMNHLIHWKFDASTRQLRSSMDLSSRTSSTHHKGLIVLIVTFHSNFCGVCMVSFVATKFYTGLPLVQDAVQNGVRKIYT